MVLVVATVTKKEFITTSLKEFPLTTQEWVSNKEILAVIKFSGQVPNRLYKKIDDLNLGGALAQYIRHKKDFG